MKKETKLLLLKNSNATGYHPYNVGIFSSEMLLQEYVDNHPEIAYPECEEFYLDDPDKEEDEE